MTKVGTDKVARRQVFYVPGYDPYPPRRYRELYRAEGQKQAQISGYDITQSMAQGAADWHVSATINGVQTETDITVLVWNDLVKSSMAPSLLATYTALVKTAWAYLSTGSLLRLARLSKGPIIAALYPVAMLLLQLVCAVLAASLLGQFAAGGMGALAPETSALTRLATFWLGFAACMWLILRWFQRLDGKFFAHYLIHDYAFTASRNGAYPPEIEARLNDFRAQVAAALRSDSDEVLIVGHSSGAQLAVSLMADLLRDNEACNPGPALSLLTLGQVIPMVSFLPNAARLRSDLALLSVSDDITWVDISAPGDGCCFALSDPVAVSGVAPQTGQKWPLVISAAFSQSLTKATYNALKRRYFRLHFQYLCAFDAPKGYDYFQITAGPQTLGTRFAGRASSKSRIAAPASKYTSLTNAAAGG